MCLQGITQNKYNEYNKTNSVLSPLFRQYKFFAQIYTLWKSKFEGIMLLPC